MKKHFSFFLFLTCLVFFLMACSLAGGSAGTQEADTPAPNQPASNTPASPDVPTPTPEAQALPVQGTGDFHLADTAAGLDGLHSYRQILQTSFEGTIGDEEQHSQTTLKREIVDEPATELIWIETDSQGVQFFGRIGGIQYRQPSPAEACFAFPEAAAGLPSAAGYPFASLPPIAGATFADEGEVNGMPAKHYTFDERAIGFPSPAKAQGEVWVAASGGYVLRYTLSLEAYDDQLGPGVSGVQTWSYDLSEVDAGSAGLPEDCVPVTEGAGISRLEGAVVILEQPGYVVYQAPGSMEEAVAFYQEQAEALGWSAGTPVEFGSVTRLALRPGDGSLIQLTFEMDGDSLTVTEQSLAPSPEE